MARTATQFMLTENFHRRNDLTRFIIISVIIHAIAIIMQGIMPAKLADPEVKPPIKVKYIQPEKKPEPAKKRSTLIDAPEPAKVEAPRSSELLASHNSRAHSNNRTKKAKKYQAKKTLVPKLDGQRMARRDPVKTPVSKPVDQPKPKKKYIEKTPNYPLSDRGFITQEKTKSVPAPPTPQQQTKPGSTMSLLDGFDPSKYAALDTGSSIDEDDDEPISLDTKETKYASYFARIKHQIERVWAYPEEAARRGISGELTLRFQIQRDGDLMDVRLIEGSGSELLDFAALKAIKSAAPFYPFPVTIEKNKISILATFIYSPSYGASRRAGGGNVQ